MIQTQENDKKPHFGVSLILASSVTRYHGQLSAIIMHNVRKKLMI